jgi:hypothetical protein
MAFTMLRARLNSSSDFEHSSFYREDFNSFDEFVSLRFTATGAPPAARQMRILLMKQPITFGMK